MLEKPFLPQSLEISKVYEQKLLDGLYIVSTPIGNIFDITIRAIAILHQSKCILAEDTRVAKKLLSFYGISTPIISCNNYTELKDNILDSLQKGGIISLVSDAGTPLISDPGYKLINWCIKESINIYPVPGACSAICGLCVSGLPTDEFHFSGFLPPKHGARIKQLREQKNINATLIFLESPNRILDSLTDMLSIFGDRPAYIGRELTKYFEEHKRGCITELISYFQEHKPIGEFIIAVSGNSDIQNDENNDDVITNRLSTLLQSMSIKDAVNEIKKDSNISKSKIYKMALDLK